MGGTLPSFHRALTPTSPWCAPPGCSGLKRLALLQLSCLYPLILAPPMQFRCSRPLLVSSKLFAGISLPPLHPYYYHSPLPYYYHYHALPSVCQPALPTEVTCGNLTDYLLLHVITVKITLTHIPARHQEDKALCEASRRYS